MEYDMDIPVFHRHVLGISKSEVGFPRTALFQVGLWDFRDFQGGIFFFFFKCLIYLDPRTREKYKLRQWNKMGISDFQAAGTKPTLWNPCLIRPEQNRPDEQTRTEQNRTEQNRTEQNRTERNRTEQNRTEQNRTEPERNNRTEQNRNPDGMVACRQT